MAPKREGPNVRLIMMTSCDGCLHDRSEYYCIEDGNDCDSGFNHFCGALGDKTTGDGIPKGDCPFMKEAVARATEAFLNEQSKDL